MRKSRLFPLLLTLFVSSVAWRTGYIYGQQILIDKLINNDFEELIYYDTDPNGTARFYYFYYDHKAYIG